VSLVAILSPYAGDVERNVLYAKQAMLNSIGHGETPIVPHLLYTQVLNDEIPSDRLLGLNLGAQWFSVIDYAVVYLDHGISEGMSKEIDQLTGMDIRFINRKIL